MNDTIDTDYLSASFAMLNTTGDFICILLTVRAGVTTGPWSLLFYFLCQRSCPLFSASVVTAIKAMAWRAAEASWRNRTGWFTWWDNWSK